MTPPDPGDHAGAHGGQLADMDALAKLSADTGVPLVQDAAHAHGAQWHGKKVGELGSIAAFSFQNGKLMTAGEGGAVLFPDEMLYESAFLRHSCGRPRTDRGYFHKTSGSNFRLNEFSASVLRAQLSRLDGQIDIREQRWPLLAGLLAEIDGVVPQSYDERCTRNPHYMAMFRVPGITEDRRNAMVDTLVERGLPAFAAFRAIYRSTGFWETGAPEESLEAVARRCPNTEAISADCVWLHHRTLLGTEAQMHEIAEIVDDAGHPVMTRVAVVGLGWAGRVIWLPRLLAHAQFEVTAVVDPEPMVRATATAGLAGVRACASVEELSSADIDLAVVAVPNHLHAEVACGLLRSGISVFLEKPVCLDSAEADLLSEAELLGGATLLAGSAARYRADVQALYGLLDSLGEIRHVDVSWIRARGVPDAGGWFTHRKLAGGGALVDLGWHLLDTLCALLGPVDFDHVVGTMSDDFVDSAGLEHRMAV